MRPLDLKLLRDLKTMKGQVIAVGMVMACGLAVMIMARSLMLSLEVALEDYYRNHHFSEAFVDLKRAPNSLRGRLAEISGVGLVETRVSSPLILDIPGMKMPADGMVYSLAEDRPQLLNQLYLRRGRMPDPAGRKEVVVSEAFATAHGFMPGDSLEVTIYGSRERLRIVGIGLSPEFVYELRPGGALPDSERFGVFWMNERELSAALNMSGAFNNVVLDLAPGANLKQVLEELDTLLKPYGGQVAYGRREHASARQIDDRIEVLKGISIVFPAVFLSIAIFMTSAAMTRLVRLQREQIAQLKALGYGTWAIGSHYMKFVLVMVLIGSLLGIAVGLWLGHHETMVYRRFFQFPRLDFYPDWSMIAFGCVLSAFACMIGVSGAVWQAVRLPPAEAMRPEPPAKFRKSFLERLKIQHLVSTTMLMALRNLERKPWQSLFTMLGLSLAAAIPIIPGAVRDGIAYVMEFEWGLVQRQDATIHLIEHGAYPVETEIQGFPGVMASEAFRKVPGQIHHGHLHRRVVVTGVSEEAQLSRLMDRTGAALSLSGEGVWLSNKLAEILEVEVGDPVRMEILEGRRPVVEARVAGMVTDYAGLGVYMEIEFLRRLMREGKTISGVHVSVDPLYWDDFVVRVKQSPRIRSLAVTTASRQSYQETTGDMLDIMQVIYLTFAVIVAFGVVYNSARIALSERSRDLATLRVIGFLPHQVAGVLISELVILTLLALPIGFYGGGVLAGVIVNALDTESVRIPLVLEPSIYALSLLVILISSSISFAVVSRRIHLLDMLGVLSAKD